MSNLMASDELLRLTRLMLTAAEAGSWEEVGKIENERQAVLMGLEALTSNSEMSSTIDRMAGQIQEVLSLNKRLVELSQSAKRELGDAMTSLSKGRKAVSSYYGAG